jgi:hypothetical protein
MVLQISQNFIEKNCKKHTPPKKKQSLFWGGGGVANSVNNLDTYTPQPQFINNKKIFFWKIVPHFIYFHKLKKRKKGTEEAWCLFLRAIQI